MRAWKTYLSICMNVCVYVHSEIENMSRKVRV